MFNRLIKPSKNNSFFIFGARGTGKTTWLKEEFIGDQPVFLIDFLNPDTEEKYAKNPGLLKDELLGYAKKPKWVVLDEVQKVPKILDVVHGCIESLKQKFVLTGSSARKLKRGHANLLGGRAFVHHLYPLTHAEMDEAFSLNDVLRWGSLPQTHSYDDELDKQRYLKSYGQTYLREEILIEQVVRKIDPFRHFLEIAAQVNGEIVNFTNIARDVGVDTVTVQSYFQILEDTWVGYLLPAHHKSLRKQQRQNPKFYFFDLGVTRALAGLLSQPLDSGTYGYGKAFEHFVILEIMRLNSYCEKDFRLSYLRTKDDAEVDLIVERPGAKTVFVEIKSATETDERSVRGLKNFRDVKDAEFYLLSQDPQAKIIDGVSIFPWREGLAKIGFI